MRIERRPFRRAAFAWRCLITSVVAFALALGSLTLVAGSASAKALVDDYPAYLKAKPRDALVDPWYFYSRECTSFVAWRLTNDNKIPFTNNWAGAHFGNAYEWAAAAKKLGFAVDNTPTVGSVAWWNQNSSGSVYGHVAWVAKVNADKSVLIEEYNYVAAGVYSQRTLKPNTSSWPSGFLHIDGLTMVNTVKPTIPGVPTVGVALTATPGTWTPTGSQTFKYAWFAGGVAIPGATKKKYTPTPDVVGKKLKVKVTASRPSAKALTVASAASTPVAAGTLTAVGIPAVVGTAQVGLALTAQSTWKQPAALSYQWSSNGVAIPDARAQAYTPQPADVGTALSVAVTATAVGYKPATARIATATTVAPGVFTNSKVPVISGKPTVGTALGASPGTWSPTATYGYQWFAGSQPIAGATAAAYIPTAAELGKKLKVKVTASSPGYTSKTVASAVTKVVNPGVFTAPALTALPTPAVGAALVAQPGVITGTTTPSLSYQWNLDGKAIAGATSATYKPRPGQLSRRLSVTITASAPGYRDLVRTTPLSRPVALGALAVKTPPTVGATPRYGRAVPYTPAVWSAKTATVRYQWFANGKAIKGATGLRYKPTTGNVGKALSVTEYVTAKGYHPHTVHTVSAGIVQGGVTSLSASPTIKGAALVGSVLKAQAGNPFPAKGMRTIQWLRDGAPIAKATGWKYRPKIADIGHALTAQVTVSRALWTSTTTTSKPTAIVRAPVTVVVRLVRGPAGKVRVRATITATGVSPIGGRIAVRKSGALLGREQVVAGKTTFDVTVPRSVKRVNVVYKGDRRVQVIKLKRVLIR